MSDCMANLCPVSAESPYLRCDSCDHSRYEHTARGCHGHIACLCEGFYIESGER